MNSNAVRMIKALTPEIEKKCEELQNTRKERLKLCVFVAVCVMVALVPAMLVFVGIALTMLVAPLIFMALSIVLLLPVLLSGKNAAQGGNVYEQA